MNKNTKLQFTELTPDDIATHEDLYIEELLISGFHGLPYCYTQLYYDYAIKELQKRMGIFYQTFK